MVNRTELERILNHLPNPACIAKPDTRLDFINPAFTRSLGYSPADITGREFMDFVPEYLRSQYKTSFLRFMTDSAPSQPHTKLQIQTKHNGIHDVHVTLDRYENPGIIVAYLDDVTAEVEAQSRLSHLLRELRHDMGAPLNGILGGAQILEEHSDSEVLEMARMISNSGEYLYGMIEDILGEHEDSFKPNKTKLKDIMTHVRRDILFQTTEPRINESDSLRNMYDATIYVDPVKLRRVFSNLMKNAILIDKEVSVDYRQERSAHLFTFSNPTPIPEAIRPYLFTQQVPSLNGGTGSGLYYCGKLVHQHGGEISYAITPQTEITVKLPIVHSRN